MVRAGRLALGLLLAALLAFASAAAAHPGRDPYDYEIRLLHDCNDDWGGHSTVNDGHDLIALDLQEAYDDALDSDVVIFRLMMNGGYNSDTTRPELKESVTLKVGSTTVTKEIRTSDNAAFTGSFDAVRGPFPVKNNEGNTDGNRFAVEAVAKLSTLVAQVGTKVSAFAVQGYAGTAKADQMPGGYTTGGQTITSCPPAAEAADYTRPEFTLAGPSKYASLVLNRNQVSMQPGDNESVSLTVGSLLFKDRAHEDSVDYDQAVTIEAVAPAGVEVIFHTTTYSVGETSFDLAAGAEAAGHFYLRPGPSAESGTVSVVLTTDLGGRVEKEFALTIRPADVTESSSPTPSEMPPAEKGGPLPVPAAFPLAAFVAGVVLLRRRQWL